jgi:SpoVK/Ycf46/Vps4 family AAA+-type ATPase
MDASNRAQLFELDIPLPDRRLSEVAATLVGFDRRFERVGRSLQALLDPESVATWARKFHGPDLPVARLLAQRYPLVILDGDVGTGKSAFAECAADRLTRVTHREGRLMKLSTRVRGSGQVGQMSDLINQAFAAVAQEAGKRRLAFLVIDEADSLAANREGDRSHHEDKVAVNTLTQKIDAARSLDGRLLVFLATNRPNALDPALVRRAGGRERFLRPSGEERLELLKRDVEGLGVAPETLRRLVTLTGPESHDGLGFTFSDLRTRLLPEAVLRAYPDRPLSDADLLATAEAMAPSPALLESPAVA